MAHIEDIKPGALFTHYKNKDYQIITIATDEATLDKVVVYKALYGDYGDWIRRVDRFCETVEVDGEMLERFKLKHAA
jgi:hypothetical protein